MPTDLTVLILDQPEDAARMVGALQEVGFYVEARVAQTERDFRRQMDTAVQLILADPGRPGTEAVLRVLDRQRVAVPIIVVADGLDIEPLASSARDYVLKADLARLGGAVRRVLEEEAQEKERKMLQRQRRLREAQRAAPEARRSG